MELWKNKKGVITVSFYLALVLISVIMLITWSALYTLFQDREALIRNYERHEVLDDLLALMTDAETGQRGFVITGNKNFLVPYHDAVNSVDLVLEKLRTLSAEKPAWQSQVSSLELEISKKLALLKTRIDL